jgi:hypothetical protein
VQRDVHQHARRVLDGRKALAELVGLEHALQQLVGDDLSGAVVAGVLLQYRGLSGEEKQGVGATCECEVQRHELERKDGDQRDKTFN